MLLNTEISLFLLGYKEKILSGRAWGEDAYVEIDIYRKVGAEAPTCAAKAYCAVIINFSVYHVIVTLPPKKDVIARSDALYFYFFYSNVFHRVIVFTVLISKPNGPRRARRTHRIIGRSLSDD